MHADDISSRARHIHSTSIVFDTHTDTPQRFLFDHFDLGHRDAEGGHCEKLDLAIDAVATIPPNIT